MRNPWLDIPLADYEAHMALPTVGQQRLIADQLDTLIGTYSPSSVAILGCAGGNGFDRLVRTSARRVVGVDINPDYIEQARRRYAGSIPGLELHIADIQSSASLFDPVDLIYAVGFNFRLALMATTRRLPPWQPFGVRALHVDQVHPA